MTTRSPVSRSHRTLSALPRWLGRISIAVLIAGLAACGGGGDAAEPADGSDPPVTVPPPAAPPSSPTTPPATPPVTPPVTPPSGGASGVGSAAGVPIDRAAFGGAMSSAEFEAATGRLSAFLVAWKAARTDLPSLTAEAYASALSTSLSTHADAPYVNVSERDFTVTVQLRDGTPFIIPTRFAADGSARRLTAEGSPRIAAAMPAAPAPAAPGTAGAARKGNALQATAAAADPVMPLGRRVVSFNGFDNSLHEQTHRRVIDLFTSVGYDAQTEALSLDALMSVGFVDVFWIDTHGLYPKIKHVPGAAAVTTYALLIPMPPTCSMQPTTCARNDALLAGGLVLAGDASWAITPSFVSTYLKFTGPRSLALLDACESGQDNAGPVEMRRAFQAAGAGHVLGWVKEVYSGSGARIVTDFFDVALGTNRYFKDKYALRPQSVFDVYDYLKGKGKLHDDEPGVPGDPRYPPGDADLAISGLTLPPSIASNLILRPSLQSFSIREDAAMSRISILGLFGDQPGAVTVNGQALLNVTWGPWGIEADLPNAGPAVAGDIVVESARVRSSPVPITLWQGTVEQTARYVSGFGAPGFDLAVSCRAAFREDLHDSRANLNGTPTHGVFGYFDLTPIKSAEMNSCTWGVSGEGRIGDVRTLAAPAADAVTTQSAPDYTNLQFGITGDGRLMTLFGVAVPMQYKRYDKDGKLFSEGSFTFGGDPQLVNRNTTLAADWSISGSGTSAGDDPRDTTRFTLSIKPRFLPTAQTAR